MIKCYKNPRKNSIIGVLENISLDAFNSLQRKVGMDVEIPANVKKASLMPSSFRTEVFCEGSDVFDEDFGRKRAKKIILDNYQKSKEKALKRAQAVLIKHIEALKTGL